MHCCAWASAPFVKFAITSLLTAGKLGKLVAVVWREDKIEAMVFIATAAVILVVTFGRTRGLPVGGIMLGFRPARNVLSGIA
jgi:hypothetical protein